MNVFGEKMGARYALGCYFFLGVAILTLWSGTGVLALLSAIVVAYLGMKKEQERGSGGMWYPGEAEHEFTYRDLFDSPAHMREQERMR